MEHKDNILEMGLKLEELLHKAECAVLGISANEEE